MFEYLTKKKLADLNAAEATSRIEAEIVLPEYKEEAERIIRARPKAVIRSKSVYLRDKMLICEVEGTVGFHVLYQTAPKEEGEKASSFLHTEAFTQTLQFPLGAEEIAEEDVVLFAEAVPRSALVKLMGPRKLSAKCEVSVSVNVKCNQSVSLFPEMPAEDLITRGEEVKLTRLCKTHTEEMSFSQTISLPKAYLPIEEICEMEAVLFTQNVRSEDGGVSFLGLCDLHCSYMAAGENLFVSFYQPIEFERRLGIAELSGDSFCRVSLTPVSLKATPEINEDGDNKNILFELSFLCEVCGFETESVIMTTDAFSTRNHILTEKKRETTRELLGVFDFTDTVKALLPSKNAEVVRAEGICAGVEFRNSYLEEGKICLEGKLLFSYLGITESGEMRNYEDSYEFHSHITPAFSIPEGEECSVEVYGCARGIDVEPEGEQFRLRFDLCGSVSVFITHRPELICKLERGEEIVRKRGEIIFIYPREGEDLWSLAKEYHIPPESVKAQNHLTGETLPTYLKLIR